MKKNFGNFFQYAVYFIAWVISWLLFAYFIIIGRTVLLSILRNYWIQGHFNREYAMNFIDRMFVLILGLAWVIFMLVIESYFRNGVKKKNLYQRIGKVLGPEILAIFMIDLLMVSFTGFAVQPWSRLLLMLLELLAGLGLVWVGWFMKRKNPIEARV
jgi:hypothetical protein